MNRSALFVAFGLATLVLSLALVALGNRRTTGPYSPSQLAAALRGVEERLADLERLATGNREALTEFGRVPPRSRTASSLAATPSEQSEDDAVSDAGGDDETDPPPELEALVARLDTVELHLKGLAEDPIQRGYTFLESADPGLRREGVYTLERLAARDPEAREAIRAALNDDDARVRQVAIDTLADVEDKGAAPFIAALLDDENTKVRGEAIDALSRLGAKDSASSIAGLLADEQDWVREKAADALGKLRTPDVMPQLVAALQDPHEDVRGQAISSLGEIGAKDAQPHLRQLYDDGSTRHRTRLILALKALGDTQPLEEELTRHSNRALEADTAKERRDALRNLSWLGGKQSREIFREALNDADPAVREEAKRALSRLEGGRR